MQPGLQLPEPDKLCPPERRKAYLSIVGPLLYATGATCPETAFAVNYLAGFTQGPQDEHFAATPQVVCYFRTYPNLGIIYRARKESDTVGHYSRLREVVNRVKSSKHEITVVESQPLNEIDNLIGFTNLAYNDDVTTGRSTMGYIFLDQGGGVAWSSKQQKDPALS
jgi:hypothetical protein